MNLALIFCISLSLIGCGREDIKESETIQQETIGQDVEVEIQQPEVVYHGIGKLIRLDKESALVEEKGTGEKMMLFFSPEIKLPESIDEGAEISFEYKGQRREGELITISEVTRIKIETIKEEVHLDVHGKVEGLPEKEKMSDGSEIVMITEFGTVNDVGDGEMLITLANDELQIVAQFDDDVYVDDEIEIGDYVCISYDGMISKSVPALVPNVEGILKVVDEKEHKVSKIIVYKSDGELLALYKESIVFRNPLGEEKTVKRDFTTILDNGLQVGDKITITYTNDGDCYDVRKRSEVDEEV